MDLTRIVRYLIGGLPSSPSFAAIAAWNNTPSDMQPWVSANQYERHEPDWTLAGSSLRYSPMKSTLRALSSTSLPKHPWIAYEMQVLVLPSPGQPLSSNNWPGAKPRTWSASLDRIRVSKLALPDDSRGPSRLDLSRLEAF